MNNNFLIDLGWLELFNSNPSWERSKRDLSNPVSNASTSERAQAISYVDIGPILGPILSFLEQIVVSEKLIIDEAALSESTFSLPAGLESEFTKICPNQRVYEKTVKNTFNILRGIFNGGDEVMTREELDNQLWSMAEKQYHDILSKSAFFPTASLAATNNSAARAIFYLEFSKELGFPPFLSKDKKNWLEFLRKLTRPTFHECITKLFKGAIFNDLEEFIGDVDVYPAMPPVAELIVRNSIMKAIPLDEATLEIKYLPGARDYRKLLNELEGAMRRGWSGRSDVQKILQSLKKVADVWGKSIDFDLNVTRSQRTFKIGKLPIIGKLLEVASMDELTIKDFILNSPPGYIVFIREWFKGPDEGC
jgi:hypothetical protein